MKLFKERILQLCKDAISKKISILQEAIREATEAANNETKSTAGDKHETARAMMQLEQEKLNIQLNDWQDLKLLLDKIIITTDNSDTRTGSLIETDRGLFFIAGNIGKIDIDGKTVMVISARSPLGEAMLKHKTGDVFKLHNQSYSIIKVA